MSADIVRKKKRKDLIINIILYVISGILILLTTLGIIVRLSNAGALYVFGNRFDIVLTGSMSAKNPEYADFLKDCNNQIQPFDLVISKKVSSEKELDVFDIVLFQNPGIGVDMHRIVGKKLISSNRLTATNSYYKKIGNYEGICLQDYTSAIVSNSISPDKVTFTTFSTEVTEDSHFNFTILTDSLEVEMSKQYVSEGVITTYYITRKGTTPGAFAITHAKEYDFSNEIVTNCTITLKDGGDSLNLDKENLTSVGDNLVSSFNQKYEYEIRGDLSNTSDGTFKFESIITKVNVAIPKLGYLFSYLSSIWGIIMFVSIGVLIIVYDIISSRVKKKEEAKLANETEDKGKDEMTNDKE